MQLSHSSMVRLSAQEELILQLIQNLDGKTITVQPLPGKWSIHENLAHLGRYHQIFSMRIKRILREEQPLFERYNAKEDPGSNSWMTLSTSKVLSRLQLERKKIDDRLTSLDPGDLARTGQHPKLGVMMIPLWFDFFLLHEAHHIYTIFRIMGQFRSEK